MLHSTTMQWCDVKVDGAMLTDEAGRKPRVAVMYNGFDHYDACVTTHAYGVVVLLLLFLLLLVLSLYSHCGLRVWRLSGVVYKNL
jgi:hypothetical protein